jgi:hypothetical protein
MWPSVATSGVTILGACRCSFSRLRRSRRRAITHRRAYIRTATKEAEQSFDVSLAIEGAEHAGRGRRWRRSGAEASAEGFAVGAPAEVVVAASPCRLGEELELARPRLELDHGPAQAVNIDPLPVDATSVEVLERGLEPTEVVFAH